MSSNTYDNFIKIIQHSERSNYNFFMLRHDLEDEHAPDLVKALRTITNITELDLADNAFGNKFIQILAQGLYEFSELHKITKLNLSYTFIGTAVKYLAITYLQKIILDCCSIDEELICFTENELSRKNLSYLSVDNCFVSNETAKKLLAHPNLTTLSMTSNNLDDGALENYSNSVLEDLCLSHNSIKNNCISSVSLLKLNLAYNCVEFEFIKNINKLLPNLGELDLDCNNIGDDSADILSKHPRLKILNVANNNITVKGAISFINNPTLRILNLSYNKIDTECHEMLKYYMDNIDIDLQGF